jgi:hypothetical protein
MLLNIKYYCTLDMMTAKKSDQNTVKTDVGPVSNAMVRISVEQPVWKGGPLRHE